MLRFQDNKDYKLKKSEIFLFDEFVPNWRQHLDSVIPFNKNDFMNFLSFVKEEENIEYSRTLLDICKYFGVNKGILDDIMSKLPNLFTNFWENADQILELEFDELINNTTKHLIISNQMELKA